MHQSFLKIDLHRSCWIFRRFECIIYKNYLLSIHMAPWKESMINRLSNLINRNRSAAEISQILCSNPNARSSVFRFFGVHKSWVSFLNKLVLLQVFQLSVGNKAFMAGIRDKLIFLHSYAFTSCPTLHLSRIFLSRCYMH